jgi:hypothetical protein
MARSRRRTPITGMATLASEKQDKRWSNRKCRSARRGALKRGQDPDKRYARSRPDEHAGGFATSVTVMS